MLSNKAVPRYYGEFREKVLRGDIPVCEEISLQMNRIDERIANPLYYYDDEAVEGWVNFCEAEMTLTNGDDLVLLDTFKLWGEDLFGWWYFEDKQVYEPTPDNHGGHYVWKTVIKRLTEKQYIIVARGAAKSLYDTLIQAYGLIVDRETTKQITTAPTMKQAEEVMEPFRTAIIRSRGPVFKFLTFGSLQNTTGDRALRQKLVSTKKGIENFLTGSILEIRPMSVDKLQGARPKYSTVDEWLSGETREDVVAALEQGASKNEGWMIIAVSSEGTVRNGAGDTIKLELMKVLKGDFYAPQISIWHYKLDDAAEVADPRMWPKAQPNIGKTVSYDTYQKDVERMEKVPSSVNEILAKRFGIPREGHSYFFTYEETEPHRRQNFWRLPCSMGADLSQGDDFCAFTFVFPLGNDRFGVKTRSYITELTLMKLPAATRNKYEEFISEGTLCIMPGVVLDMMEVYEDLDTYVIDQEFDVRCLGYDPYNAKEFVARWDRENGPFSVKVIQGAKTESVPLGELKKLAERRLLIFDQLLMQYAMSNSMVLEDTNGNLKLFKKRYEEKIDNVSALMDGYIAYKAHKEQFE